MPEFKITLESDGRVYELSQEALERAAIAEAHHAMHGPKPLHHVAAGFRDHWIGCLWFLAESWARCLEGGAWGPHLLPFSVAVSVPFAAYYGHHHLKRAHRALKARLG